MVASFCHMGYRSYYGLYDEDSYGAGMHTRDAFKGEIRFTESRKFVTGL
jgi:hypothetical protein